METILLIDRFLQLTIVRWMLLVATVAMLASTVYYRLQYGVSELQLKGAKGDVASYAAHIDMQNALVAKAGQDYEISKKKALASQQEAEKMKQAFDNMSKINIAPNTCELMVGQAIAELKSGP